MPKEVTDYLVVVCHTYKAGATVHTPTALVLILGASAMACLDNKNKYLGCEIETAKEIYI